ncbi:ferric reductase-like transmembrane domain-containing protein [Bacillus sp. REN10]|uniref:ferric reductase-like transmembrane domain-containing protein n=1 Tax=Bacillus sp. REN10 TaxID=2782541 RepID=UPI00193B7B5A|nr:ferric reductase-like transmembrane domain-containing protein [Bacillus sp. REN10]
MNMIYTTWEWIRASGMTAYLLLFIANMAGLLVKGKMVSKKGRPVLLMIHQTAGWLALLLALFHAMMLLFDHYVSYTITELLIPFTATYQRLASAAGTIACYILVLLFFSSDVMKRIGRKWWKVIHFLALPSYLLALIHGILIGTDSGAIWMILVYAITFGVLSSLFFVRLLTARS